MTVEPHDLIGLMALVQQLHDRVEVLEKIVAQSYRRELRALVEDEQAALAAEQMKRAS